MKPRVTFLTSMLSMGIPTDHTAQVDKSIHGLEVVLILCDLWFIQENSLFDGSLAPFLFGESKYGSRFMF
jgi:hypothetical protein